MCVYKHSPGVHKGRERRGGGVVCTSAHACVCRVEKGSATEKHGVLLLCHIRA